MPKQYTHQELVDEFERRRKEGGTIVNFLEWVSQNFMLKSGSEGDVAQDSLSKDPDGGGSLLALAEDLRTQVSELEDMLRMVLSGAQLKVDQLGFTLTLERGGGPVTYSGATLSSLAAALPKSPGTPEDTGEGAADEGPQGDE